MEHALYDYIVSNLTNHGVNTALAILIFIFAKAKYKQLIKEHDTQCKRIARIERACYKYQIELGKLEEE